MTDEDIKKLLPGFEKWWRKKGYAPLDWKSGIILWEEYQEYRGTKKQEYRGTKKTDK